MWNLPTHPRRDSCGSVEARVYSRREEDGSGRRAMRSAASKIAQVTRRDFLKASAAGSASLIIGFYLPSNAAEAAGKTLAPNAYVAIHPNGEIQLWVARSEMGQGPRTSLAMIL